MKKGVSIVLGLGVLLGVTETCCSTTLYERQSLYHYIRVEQNGTVRMLRFRHRGTDSEESAIDIADPLRMVMQYTRLMFAGFLFVPRPKRVLLVGLGGGTLSRVIAHYFPEAQVDTVELDPEVVKVAERYFLFRKKANAKVYVRDGRVHIRILSRLKAKYDIIMLDAFRGGYIPYHLTTKEFLEECRSILAPGGVVVSNLWPSSLLYEYQRRTHAKIFDRLYAFGSTGNKILVSIPRKIVLTKEDLYARAEQVQNQRRFSFKMKEVVDEFDPRVDYPIRGRILVDGHAPANILRSQPLR